MSEWDDMTDEEMLTETLRMEADLYEVTGALPDDEEDGAIASAVAAL